MMNTSLVTGCVYQIKNLVNDKCYIGSTTQYQDRIRLHRRQLQVGKHHSRHLQRSWVRYGEASFEFVVLQVFIDVLLTTLLEAEQKWMDSLKVINPMFGYNTVPLAGSNAGRTMPPGFGTRISALLKGRKFTPEHRARIAEASRKHHHSAATKAKLRAIALARPPRKLGSCPSEVRAKISASLKGKTLSEGTKQKIRESKLGKKRPDVSVRRLGQKLSAETKAKLRVARLGKRMSEESKAKVGNANRGRRHTEEARAKMREAHSRRRLSFTP